MTQLKGQTQRAPRSRSKILIPVVLMAAAGYFYQGPDRASAQAVTRFTGPTSSQPLALSADDSLLAVANPDNDTVTFFDARNNNQRLAEIRVGREPNGVAVSPDGTRAYVANTVDGTISVLTIDRASSAFATVVNTVRVGTEPYGIALTPAGRRLYVANARSNTVSVIDTTAGYSVKTIANVGPEPRGIAISNSGQADDTQELIYVTQFLSVPIAGKRDGSDDAKAGHVTVISGANDTVLADIVVNPLADSGFKAAGDALQKIAPPATPVAADFRFATGAYPNQLNNIALRGRFAFVPNTGASPNGPVRFNVNTQSLLSVLDTATRQDARRTINMHLAVEEQTATPKRFITQPWAVALKRRADEGYVVSAGSNIVVKFKFDPALGTSTVQRDPADANRVLEIPTGKNPRGIVINSTDTTAYVMNYVSRDVTVIDLQGNERVTATVRSATLPTAGTPEDRIHAGKELYNSAVGDLDPAAAGGAAITGRMSNNGWGSCGSCHPFGLTDNVVWIFGGGPRKTISQHTDFDQTDAARRHLRTLNWSAERDEEADFELNIRAVSGGQGLIVGADGTTQEPAVANFTPNPSKGRNQLKIRGVPAWDALEAYMQFGIRAPISPLRGSTDPDIAAGRTWFTQANCQACHGGPQWTTARVRFTPVPDASTVVAGQLIAELRKVGTFTATDANEVRANGAVPLGADGFVPPSLLSLHAFPQTFLHGGAANSLDAVWDNVAHRSAGTGADTLQDAARRAQLTKFVLSIDASTPPIAPNAPTRLTVTSAAWNTGSKIAPDSLAAGYGTGLASQAVSPPAPLPVAINGTTVSIQDAAGKVRLGQFFYVGPTQVNFVVPAGTGTGNALVTVTGATGDTATADVEIANVAPSVFTMPGGTTAAAFGLRATADGAQSPVAIFECSAVPVCTPTPIDLGAPSDIVVVTLFGTGVRKNSGLANVRATIGGADATVFFAGAQGQFPGFDQINVQIPQSLRGRGTVPAVVTVDGQSTNSVTLSVR